MLNSKVAYNNASSLQLYYLEGLCDTQSLTFQRKVCFGMVSGLNKKSECSSMNINLKKESEK